MRLSPETGKTDCHIIDFVDSYSRVPGLVSLPTLFGLDIEEDVEGSTRILVASHDFFSFKFSDETIESLESRAEHLDGVPAEGFTSTSVPEPTSVTYIDYENPFVSY
jgi:ATP-dependent helicase IRC3